ncbi:RicAFT regulatory complex protein RicA family protein [Pseudalkalibacillus salsuginis]|uniref:RicAFT regulatory complex protein RicA family protein n=1 Tax=Pseudalkalibacillus salsuginis TaxID=2910972 RepID=UPI001F1B3D6E|nr:RicAFT regulatory complex protein RicA family protein [Pseudalkalibacillus salsuginis]MCF6410649.1 RicAFT regulatory complex protein RicA family protein [Pseudalkalibacillus salsuginis]
MAHYTRKQVIEKAEELAKMISSTEEVDFFKKAEEKINENDKVQKLIGKIKMYQQEAVNLQHYQKHEALKRVEDKLASLHAEVDAIPIVMEFKQSQTDVNDLLQLITSTISNTVTNEIIRETGGDQLKGMTGSAVKHKRY